MNINQVCILLKLLCLILKRFLVFVCQNYINARYNLGKNKFWRITTIIWDSWFNLLGMTALVSFITYFFKVTNGLSIKFFVGKKNFFPWTQNSTLIILHGIVCLCLFSGWIQLMSVHFSIKGYEKSRSLNNIAGLAGNALRLSPVTSPYNSPCPLRRSRSPIPSIL